MADFPARTALYATLMVLGLTGTAFAQGGGFVFEDGNSEDGLVTPEAAPPQPEAGAGADSIPVTEDDGDTLDDFTFGGQPGADSEQTAIPVEERDLWDAVRLAPSADGYRQYLDAYPDGAFADQARERIAELQAAADRTMGLIASCDTLAGDPDDPTLSAGVAGVPLEAIDADAALWTCSRARAAAPDMPRLSYNLARIAESQGQIQSALRGYRIALRLAIERTGEPHLQAASGILRLDDEPRNPTDAMSKFLLQFAVDGAGRLRALQARVAELEAELAVTSADISAAEDEIARLEQEIEFLTAREIDLLSTLDNAEVENEGIEDLEVELAEIVQALRQAEAARAAAIAETVALQAERDEAKREVEVAELQLTERDEEIAALEAEIAALRAQIESEDEAPAPDAD
ncbi:MAG: hypothetical protein AAF748_14250 [Pseudomonadota bacterium]